MTTNEMIDCLDDQQVRDILKAIAASIEANRTTTFVADILHDWSIIEDRSIVDGPATLLTEVQRMKAELERSRAPQKA